MPSLIRHIERVTPYPFRTRLAFICAMIALSGAQAAQAQVAEEELIEAFPVCSGGELTTSGGCLATNSSTESPMLLCGDDTDGFPCCDRETGVTNDIAPTDWDDACASLHESLAEQTEAQRERVRAQVQAQTILTSINAGNPNLEGQVQVMDTMSSSSEDVLANSIESDGEVGLIAAADSSTRDDDSSCAPDDLGVQLEEAIQRDTDPQASIVFNAVGVDNEGWTAADLADLETRLQRLRSNLSDCYEREARQNPISSDHAVLIFDLGDTGRVSHVSELMLDSSRESVAECMASRAARWRLAVPDAGPGRVTVDFDVQVELP